MRLLENNPEMTQRELASALGISLGAANFCLKALVDKGWVKIDNFKKNPSKLGYFYLVTPKGIAAKTKLTMQFLKRKLIEYDELKTEIEALEKEFLRKLWPAVKLKFFSTAEYRWNVTGLLITSVDNKPFRERCDLIISNRLEPELLSVREKVSSRDFYDEN